VIFSILFYAERAGWMGDGASDVDLIVVDGT